MNRKVLVAERAGGSGDLVRMLGASYDVRSVASGADALSACHAQGPFAAVLAGEALEDMRGVALLSGLKRSFPDTVRVLVADSGTLEEAIQALHEGAIFRFLRRPLDERLLCDALEAGLLRFRQAQAERLFTEQLQFSREALLTLTETLERRLSEQVARVQGLQEFSFRLNQTHSLGDVARLAAESTSRLLGGRGVLVELDTSGSLSVRASHGPELSRDRHVQPITASDGPIGAIEIDRHVPGGVELRDADLEFLASIAAAAAIAARNQIHRRERDDAQHATIFALAGLAEYRDDETGRHLERVAEYCRLIAIGLRIDGHYLDQITETFLDDLVLSAPLHDIGKVGIPDSILFKPGRLDEDEWEIMRKHTTIGAETLLSALETSGERGFLRMGHEIAWCHHERWDGAGYPRGLAGLEIPLSARIMSVADCYDALTTWRPYKDPWPHEKAVDYIRTHGGTQFDPHVVAAFLARELEADRVRRCLADEPARAGSSA